MTAPVSPDEDRTRKIFCDGDRRGDSEPDFLSVSVIIQMSGVAYLKSDYISILVFFLLGCVYLAIGMFLSALTESPMISLYQYVRNPACFIFVGWNTGISAVFGERLYGRDHSPAEPGSPLYLEDDVKLVFERSFGSDRSDRKCGGVFYKIQCV